MGYGRVMKRLGKRYELLKKFREEYPYRLVRDHSREPDPRNVDTGKYGHFARMPNASGDEWLFLTKEGRDKFLKDYGGTVLGDR